jgi:hypothetical protein
VRRGRFISFSMLATNFFSSSSECLGFIVRRLHGQPVEVCSQKTTLKKACPPLRTCPEIWQCVPILLLLLLLR